MSYGGYGNNDPFADVGPGYGGAGAPGYGQGGYGAPGAPGYGQGGYGAPGPVAPYGGPGHPGAFGHGGGPAGRPPEPENEQRLFGLLAIGLGLLGFVLAWITAVYILGAVLAAIGLIFAIASLNREPTARGFAVTGMIAGIAGLAVAGVQLLLILLSEAAQRG